METQAWQIRRCLSFINNRLANRPNRPRNKILLQLLEHIGIVWPELEKEPEEDEGEVEYEEEGSETEDEELDETVEPLCDEPETANLAPAPVSNPEPVTTKQHAAAPVVANTEQAHVLERKTKLAESPQLPSPASVVTPPPRAKPMPAMTPEDVSWFRLMACLRTGCRDAGQTSEVGAAAAAIEDCPRGADAFEGPSKARVSASSEASR